MPTEWRHALDRKMSALFASADYRDILAWAESPRQMRLGPGAPVPDQIHARREDAEEYARWLRSPQ
jgi:hypothetical protein